MTQTFRLEIETGNAAFGGDAYERDQELARIMRTVATQLDAGEEPGILFDVNGNRVGVVLIPLQRRRPRTVRTGTS